MSCCTLESRSANWDWSWVQCLFSAATPSPIVAKLTLRTPIWFAAPLCLVRLVVRAVRALELEADLVQRLLHLLVVLRPRGVHLLELAGLVAAPRGLHLLDRAVQVRHLLPDLRHQRLHVL